MTLNRDVFFTDPLKRTIPNNGVAKVVDPTTPEQWSVLRYELETFVCEGEYQRGLERILDTYLSNLGQPEQPAVWVSGFYGSGKSHLVRVLEYLWRDTPFPGGATARGLASLPAEIQAQLRELTTASRREGGLWSAAGTLTAGVGESIGLALLAIVFRSMGLPESYPRARFVMWLKQKGLYESVRSRVESANASFDFELRNMYMSQVLAESLLAADPGFATDQKAVRALLSVQYPEVADISETDLIDTLNEALRLMSADGRKIPCTLIVLDELQQYIGDSAARSKRVQDVVEACCSRLGSRLLIVATGQSALQGTPLLARIQGRFTVRVSLSDTDVVQVVRQVVLRKDPAKEPEVRSVLDACSGEIDRQLAGTSVAPTSADKISITADYPILPARRRFWERIFRAVDRAGVAGQLRNQLEVVHAAAQAVAERPLGTVVGADFIYSKMEPNLLQTGVLLKDIAEIINGQRDGTEDGDLRARLCAAIFLIGQLPRDPGADIGIRATVDTLADLLVENLTVGSGTLRQRVPSLLAALVQRGSLMQVSDEYRLQTREGAEWTQDFQRRYNAILNDDPRIADSRAADLKAGVGKLLEGLSLLHGTSKTPRKLGLHFTLDAPPADSGGIPIWVRDEWMVSQSTVRQDAVAAGADSPTVFVFLPRRRADDLKRALAGYAAATETLQARQVATREGEEARAAMESRQREFRANIDTLVANVLNEAQVFQGGGNEIALGNLRASVEEAARASLARMFPQFNIADSARWDKVIQRVRQGSGDALAEVGYTGDANQHAAALQVLTFVGRLGKKGGDVRKHFQAAPYGWPKDAIDGCLMALVAATALQASQNGTRVSARQIDQGKIQTVDFRAESPPPPLPERLAIRGVLQAAGVTFKQNEEALAIPEYVRTMLALAASAGGAPPCPVHPDTTHLRALQALSGNEALGALFELRDRLESERIEWLEKQRQIATRLPEWSRVAQLLAYAQDLPVAAEVRPQAEAIERNCALLNEPDPLPPLAARLTDALRTALMAAYTEHERVYVEQLGSLETTEVWQRLTGDQQQQILQANGLVPIPEPRVGTEEQVLAALDDMALVEWSNRTAALPERFANALLEATRLLAPKAVRVKLPSANLVTSEEVDAYLTRVRQTIMNYIESGTPVVV